MRRRAVAARVGASILFVLAAVGCGDDGEGETMAGSETGSVGSSDSETTANVDSSGTPPADTGSSDSEGSSSGEATTMATGSEGSESSTGEPVEVFFPEVLAIIQAECFCHRGMEAAGMLDLDDDLAYDSLVNVPAPQAPGVNYVTPGDPDQSYLYLKLAGEQTSVGGSGTRMPQGGMLTDDQLLLVRNWILSGAQP